jgi:hypothetical protein
MQLPFSTPNVPKIYSLLSVGQRGAGKTVFLVGQYASLRHQHAKVWLECEDSEAQELMDNVLEYVAKTGEYPPATLKLTNFELSLKQRHLGKTQMLYQLRWWDTPGESCQVYNPAFLMMLFHSDGCCLFMDAQALVAAADDAEILDDLLRPAKSIAEILHSHQLQLPLAMILTKCDRLQSHAPTQQQLAISLKPLSRFLNSLGITYKFFESEIPIARTEGGQFTFKTHQPGAPLFWLVAEIKKASSSVVSP